MISDVTDLNKATMVNFVIDIISLMYNSVGYHYSFPIMNFKMNGRKPRQKQPVVWMLNRLFKVYMKLPELNNNYSGQIKQSGRG